MKVAAVAIGHGVFGKRSDASVQELAFEAFRAAMRVSPLPSTRTTLSLE